MGNTEICRKSEICIYYTLDVSIIGIYSEIQMVLIGFFRTNRSSSILYSMRGL